MNYKCWSLCRKNKAGVSPYCHPNLKSSSPLVLFLFVYGTLKPGEINHTRYCQAQGAAPQKAYCRGRLYALNLGYPALSFGQDRVWGYLLQFLDSSALTKIDQLEDYEPNRSPSANEYQRCLMPIYDPGDRLLETAWVYRMAPQRIRHYQGQYLPSGAWLRTK